MGRNRIHCDPRREPLPLSPPWRAKDRQLCMGSTSWNGTRPPRFVLAHSMLCPYHSMPGPETWGFRSCAAVVGVSNIPPSFLPHPPSRKGPF